MKRQKEKHLDPRVKKAVTLSLLLLVIAAFAAVGYYVGRPLVRQFRESPETFRDYVSAHGFGGKLLLIGIVMLQVIVALIPGEPFELGAGFVFGWLEGTVLCLIGTAAASALIYAAVRKWGVKLAEVFFPRERIDHFLSLLSEKKKEILLFILFLIPGTPKDLMVYIAGLTEIPLPRFLWITTLARIPSVVSSAVTGSLMQHQNHTAALITYGVTLLISAGCVVWYRRISKLERQEKERE